MPPYSASPRRISSPACSSSERITVFSAVLVFVANLSPVPRGPFRLGLPRSSRWREIVNTDSSYYGGRDVGDLHWYVGFAAFKLAVILEGVHFRYTKGQTVGAGFDTVTVHAATVTDEAKFASPL